MNKFLLKSLQLFTLLFTVNCIKHWEFKGTLSGSVVEEDVTFSVSTRSMFQFKSSCVSTQEQKEDFVQFDLYETGTYKSIVSVNQKCEVDELVHSSHPHIFQGIYKLQIYGNSGSTYEAQLVLNTTNIDIKEQKGSSEFLVEKGEMIVKTFDVSQNDIKSTEQWSYIQVTAESVDKFINLNSTTSDSDRYVGKLMVTQNSTDLNLFFANPDAGIPQSSRLSFSTFGRLTISNASQPVLAVGTWYIGVMIPNKYNKAVTYDKNVRISINVVTDYSYVPGIGFLFLASLLGLIIPFISRIIFDAANMEFDKFEWKYWFLTLKNWIWSGNKGLTYLTAFLAALLIVSAYQVVHAKYSEMMESGDRDICYYNEKCFRPYGDFYDVSVNGISSNLPFMVHGVIMVLYFSFAEAYCRSNDHKHFDYSIPYSFGLAFICEGFGSLIYHICPSQIIFQFDTLFMFVISVITIIAIHEGYSIRDNDVRYSTIAKHKAIRTPKLFAFFIGPVYFFNFIGNLITTEGLPIPFIIVFYVIFLIWWIMILAWAAYKLDLLPASLGPKNVKDPEEVVEIDAECDVTKQPHVEAVLKHSLLIRRTAFGIYCVLLLAGFVMTLLGKLSFSIFILGMLIVAQITLTLIFFIPLIWIVLTFFHKLPIKIVSTKLSVSQHFLVLLGISLYVLISCGVTALALVFFTVFSVTDKSIFPWKSRELNADCYLSNFYDTHDFWHLFASFGLMLVTMLSVQISKPCRDCYLRYISKRDKHIRRMTCLYKRSATVKDLPCDEVNGQNYVISGETGHRGSGEKRRSQEDVEEVKQSNLGKVQETSVAKNDVEDEMESGFQNPNYRSNKNETNCD